MDRRTERAFDGCFFGLLFGLLGLIIQGIILIFSLTIGGLIGFFVKGGGGNSEKELRQLKKPVAYRYQIQGVVCEGCETENEEHQTHCYMCGLELVEKQEEFPRDNNLTPAQWVLTACILVVIVFLAILPSMRGKRNANVQASDTVVETSVGNTEDVLEESFDVKQARERSQVENTPEAVLGNFLVAYMNGEGKDCSKIIGYLHPVLFPENEKSNWEEGCRSYNIRLQYIAKITVSKPRIEDGYESVVVTAQGSFVGPARPESSVTVKLIRNEGEEALWYISYFVRYSSGK